MTLTTAPPASSATPVSPPVTSVPHTEQEAALRPMWEQAMLYVFVIGPFAALIGGLVAAVAFGVGPSWTNVALAAVFYAVAGHGVTIGYHRYFTHGSFKANRGLKIALAIAGSLSLEGPVIRWVADHRKHHAHSDREGDPHSPWRFGTGSRALAKGLWWAHSGWLFDREQTSKERFCPDLMADRDLVRIHKAFPLWTVLTLLAPALAGGLITLSWSGALSAFFWAGLVRIAVLHHVTWSINSICHVWGSKPFASRDHATNVWPLAMISMGESWHNLHHADPTCARHGVDRGQIDSSASIISLFEGLGWARDVRWPRAERLDRRRTAA